MLETADAAIEWREPAGWDRKRMRTASAVNPEVRRAGLVIVDLTDLPDLANAPPRRIPCSLAINSLFLEKNSLIRVREFPVPLLREFGCKLLNARVDRTRKSRRMTRFCKIPC